MLVLGFTYASARFKDTSSGSNSGSISVQIETETPGRFGPRKKAGKKSSLNSFTSAAGSLEHTGSGPQNFHRRFLRI